MGKRTELGSRPYRRIRAHILAHSRVCIVCGHEGSQDTDHIIPISKGGAPLDPANLAPIHGVDGCPQCKRTCNQEKSDRPLSEVTSLNPSRDWYA
jgi:5-methylcytosine-specific restriction endonuclease McrA